MKDSSIAAAFLFLAPLTAVACNQDASPGPSTGSSAAANPGTSKPATTAPAATTAAATAAPASAAKLGLKPGEETAASCDSIKIDGECGVVVAKDSAGKTKSAEAMKALCKTGTVGATCPTTNLLGYCRAGKDLINYYYSEGGKKYDEASAKAACAKNMGRWNE